MGKGAQHQESLYSEKHKYMRAGEREGGRKEDNIERPREWVTTEAMGKSPEPPREPFLLMAFLVAVMEYLMRTTLGRKGSI